MKRLFLRNVVIIALLTACVGVGSGQTVSNDLLQTSSSSGSQEDLSSLGLGTVAFQGVALSTDTGPADTIVQHTALPAGGGTVSIQVIALHLQNTGTVTCNNSTLCGTFLGKSVEVHATINVTSATNGHISLPQPDALDPSVGSMTVPSASSPTNLLSFDSSFSTIEADIIVVQVGAGVNGTPIFTAKAPAASMSASGGVLSKSPPPWLSQLSELSHRRSLRSAIGRRNGGVSDRTIRTGPSWFLVGTGLSAYRLGSMDGSERAET